MATLAFILLFCAMIALLIATALFFIRLIMACFSAEVRGSIRRNKLAYFIWMIAALFGLYAIFATDSHGVLSGEKKAKTFNLMEQVQTAILNYQLEYDAPPPGKTNAELIRALSGDNPRNIEFLNLKPDEIDPQGNLLDAWGTPFLIKVIDPKHPLIQSAGPDKQWDSSDDLHLSSDPS